MWAGSTVRTTPRNMLSPSPFQEEGGRRETREMTDNKEKEDNEKKEKANNDKE